MKKIGIVLALIITLSYCTFLGGCKKKESVETLYEISVSLDGNTLCGKEKITFVNTTNNSFKQLKFNLFGNAFRKDAKFKPIAVQYENRACPNGYSYGEMSILSVKQQEKALDLG